MPWFRIDDGFADHPKVVQCSLASIGLWTKAGAWCSKHLTDGKVPKSMLRVWGATPRLATELVVAGLWSVTADGYEFHEWSGRNPTRAEVLEARKADADRKRGERRSTPRVQADGATIVQLDAGRKQNGLSADSDQDSSGNSHARARDPVPSPSHPDPIPTQPKPNPTLEQLLRSEKLIRGSADLAEAVAVHLAELGLARVTSDGRIDDLVWVAERPAAEVVRVVATVLADGWAQKNHGVASTPKHLRKQWHVYLNPPKRAAPKGMSEVADRAEYNEPDPEWMHDA